MFKKLFKSLNNMKTVKGIGLIVVGAAVSQVPIINTASPWIIKLGFLYASAGAVAKGVKKVQGKDAFEKEKAVINKLKPKQK